MTLLDRTPGDESLTTQPVDKECATCMRCAGAVYFVETLSDTFSEQTRRWVCGSCLATGLLSIVMKITEADYPPRVVPL